MDDAGDMHDRHLLLSMHLKRQGPYFPPTAREGCTTASSTAVAGAKREAHPKESGKRGRKVQTSWKCYLLREGVRTGWRYCTPGQSHPELQGIHFYTVSWSLGKKGTGLLSMPVTVSWVPVASWGSMRSCSGCCRVPHKASTVRCLNTHR